MAYGVATACIAQASTTHRTRPYSSIAGSYTTHASTGHGIGDREEGCTLKGRCDCSLGAWQQHSLGQYRTAHSKGVGG
eukprot:1972762-Rhodomonas_salina.1